MSDPLTAAIARSADRIAAARVVATAIVDARQQERRTMRDLGAGRFTEKIRALHDMIVERIEGAHLEAAAAATEVTEEVKHVEDIAAAWRDEAAFMRNAFREGSNSAAATPVATAEATPTATPEDAGALAE